ncbi:hypothetical protein [Vibrio superstes]|uniref:Uncharacterized protein n=1 Tax=Vibrio superstes NBRC 103154 TaxID=1219062 RepID=A0A511QTZ0_9VIBR|nr:hypothetical protein [Vibrio superstes]GEM80829.1 hypothetical protein VSU01S_30740 [Vibrio superstes NBRC 103154]
MTNIRSSLANRDARKSWKRFLTVLPMYTPLKGDLLTMAALDLSLSPNPLTYSELTTKSSLGFNTLAQQEKLMIVAGKLWHLWKTDPDVITALEQYTDVCLHQSTGKLNDSLLHHKVRGFGLLKYYFCIVQIGVFEDKSDVWERHCLLARYRLWGEYLKTIYPNMDYHYSLKGVN